MTQPILTAAEMIAAEQAEVARGVSLGALMDRAGAAVADYAWRMGGATDVLILCGPGNNGGDGYVAARILSERGCNVRIAALADPKTDIAKAARDRWNGPVEPIAEADGATLVIDALFGTGLVRPLSDELATLLADHVNRARHSLAIDLPSGIESDSGALLSPVPNFDATVALGALKPAHLLQPGAASAGQILLGDIGIETESELTIIDRPNLSAPAPGDHKYSRGYVAVAGGAMPGAARLAAHAAMRGGAGYVALAGPDSPVHPAALVNREAEDTAALGDILADERINVAVIGPGLGLDAEAEARFDQGIAAGRPLVLDADALTIAGQRGIDGLLDDVPPAILTPHHGEFVRLFGELEGSKVDRARAAARRSGAVIVYKGNDTVVASPDGRAAIGGSAPSWLAAAGTGDVLSGIIAARYAQTGDPFTAACDAVWLHSEAGRRAGAFLIADDLLDQLPAALGQCL